MMTLRSLAVMLAVSLAAALGGYAVARPHREMAHDVSLVGDNGQRVAHHSVTPPSSIGDMPGVVTVGHAKGKATLIEFYDLNCPFCRAAAPEIAHLLDTDPALKLVLVPYPILGPASVAASRVELAVAQLATPQQFYALHRKLFAQSGPIDELRAFQLARELGFDGRAIDAISDGDDITQAISKHLALGKALGFTATPGFIVGHTAIVGYPGPHTLQSIVDAAAKCGKLKC